MAILDTVPADATLESQLAFLGANMAGVVVDNLTMAEVMALIYVDANGVDLSAVTVEGIKSGDYTLADVLAMVQLKKSEQIQILAPTSAIPTTAAGLQGLSTTFTLSTYQDLINLQKLSQTTSLEGYTFTFLKILDETNQALWNFSKANVDGSGYIGIGNETYPFKGTLNTYVNGMVCTINQPVCNYISTGASFEGFNFSVSNASASISQYLVTQEGNVAQNVNLKNIVVGGTVGGNSTAVAGGLFAYVENKTTTPIVLELGDNSADTNYSVKISAAVNGVYAGGVIGVVNSEDTSTGPVQITNKMSVVSGTVSSKGTAAGGIVGKIGQNVTFTMDTVNFSATVNGNGDNGGVVGLVENATFVTSTAMAVATKVSLAASVKDKGAGGMIGKTVDAVKISVENVTLNGTTVSATPYNNYNLATYTGGIVGFWNDTAATTRTTMDEATFKNITVQASTIDGYDKAAIIGNIVGSNLLIDTVTVDSATKIGANANGLAGGVVARIRGRNIEIKNSNIEASQILGTVRGGLIGGLEGVSVGADPAGYNSQVRITDATVTTKFSTGSISASTGGIVGRVQRGSLLNLCGTINMQAPDLGSGTYLGYIAGDVESSLIYFEDSTVRETYETNRLAVANIYDNIATYSGVLENVNGLIVYDAVGTNVTGTVSGTGTEADPYKITCKEDMMRLAIVLNTDGAFGADCFGVTANPAGASQLRSAYYEITNSIDLTNTGVYDLSRNDKAADNVADTYAFKGTFSGSNADISITMDSHDTNQSNIGLFPSVKNATFKNLIIKTAVNADGTSRPWRYARHAAGIAPYVYGGINLDTVTSQVHLIARSENNKFYYGAIAGKILLNTAHGATVTTNNLTLKATIENIRVLQYTGGLAAELNSIQTAANATVTLNGTTTVGNKFVYAGSYKVGNTYHPSISGGLIGEMITGNIQANTLVKLSAENIVVDNQILDYQSSNASDLVRTTGANNEVGSGGLLGHYWDNVEADFTSITVKGSETAILGPTTTARFGGLIGRTSGKVYFHKVDLESGKFTNGISGSGLLVSSGRFVVCLLDEYVIDRDKAGDVVVENCTGNFDEIVGCTTYSEDEGGIVSIKSEGFKNMTSEGYVNQLSTTGNNSYTRYYYNLFEQSPTEYTEGMIENNILDSPAEVMVWHVNQYSTSEIKRFFWKYYDSTSNVGRGTTKYFKGDSNNELDMSGYSIYPSSLCGGATLEGIDDVKIIYNADKLVELEANRLPSNNQKQHYTMHAGLLWNPRGTTVNNITFEGSITNLGAASGVVGANSTTNLYLNNITLNGLHITGYDNAQQVGLLMSVVYNGSIVKLTGIKMTGYDDTVYGQGAGQNKYAASALIGRVGDVNNASTKIYFSDMQIPYVKVTENATNAPITTESPLRYASFIDKYEYTTNMDLYTGQGLYLFTQDEYDGITRNDDNTIKEDGDSTVTLGKEIHYGLMYDDNMVSLSQTVLDEAEANYLPYVCDTCSQTTIQVNPKRGDLLEGCGTYEDPYVLKNHKQIFQLYQYLSPKSVGNDTYLAGWTVNELGVHNTHNPVTYDLGNPDNGFPTREQLRKAYYVVTTDIDLNSISDVNDYVISNDFDGIGSSSYPFAGVIVGKDGNQYTITLPGHDKGRIKTNYGLFNIIKGAVVKDLHITTMTASDDTSKDEIYINQYGGSVAAKVVGGDNIIDNVKVSTTLSAYSGNTLLGGYVGLVEKGGLIIRNLDVDNLTSFNPLIKSGNNYIANTTAKVSAIAGKVQDGYILYEGMVGGVVNTTKKVLVAADFGFAADSLELSKTFQVVNGGYIDAKVSSDKIKITVDDEASAKTTSIVLSDSNDAQLELIALALNSDGLSSYGLINATNYNGYDENAVCRKAAYTDMGSDGTPDGQIANNYDAVHYFPYLLYKYFEINGEASSVNYDLLCQDVDVVVNKETKTIKVSKLNKLTGVTDYTTTYSLAGGTYDMTEYQYAFRGLGELYDTTPTVYTDVWYSRFNANFNGNNSTIIAGMNVDYDTAILTTGLFNDLNNFAYCNDYTVDGHEINTISNLVVEGNFVNTDTNNNIARRVGSIAGGIYGNWTFSNITLQNAEVKGDDGTGGLVGKIMIETTEKETYTNKIKFSYIFDNCKILGTKDGSGNVTVPVIITGNTGGTGGLIGYISSSVQSDYYYGGLLEITNSQVDGLVVRSASGNNGGLIGFISQLVNSTTNLDHNNLTNMTIIATTTAGSDAGGLIGRYIPVPWNTTVLTEAHALNITNNTVTDSTLSSLANFTYDHIHGIGGLVGLIGVKEANDANSIFTFDKNVVEDVTLGRWVDDGGNTTLANHAVGGLIGVTFGETLKISDCTVRNTVEPTDANAAVFTSSGTDVGGLVGQMRTRTCIIDYSHEEALWDGSTAATDATADIENLHIIGVKGAEAYRGTNVGGLLGTAAGTVYSYWANGSQATKTDGLNSKLTVSDVKIEDCIIETTDHYMGKDNQQQCGAGGAVGVVSTLANADGKVIEVEFSNVYVNGTDVAGNRSGGLIGTTSTSNDASYNTTFKDIAIRDCNVLGLAAGGLIGADYACGDRSNNYKNIIISQNNIGAYVTSGIDYTYSWAGGLIGRVNGSGYNPASATQYFNDVTIEDNYIVGHSTTLANIRVGGMIGIISNGTGGKDFFIYNPVMKNNYIGVWNDKEAKGFNLENLRTIDSSQVGLLKYESGSPLSIVDTLPATMSEKDIQKYAVGVGNIVGRKFSGMRVFVLRPTVKYADTFAVRPVVDCGVDVSTNGGTEIDGNWSITDESYPYNYRNLLHVIYFEPSGTVTEDSKAEDIINKVSASTGTPKETEYLFDSIESIQTKYAAVDDATVNTKDLLDAYRLNLYYTAPTAEKITLMELYDRAYYNGSSDAEIISAKGVTADLVGIPMIVYDAQNGTAQQVVNSFVQMLTNAGGTLCGNTSAKVSVKAKRAIVNDGEITIDTSSAKPSLTASGYTVSYNHYDTYSAESGTSITLLEISYSWTTGLGESVRETMYLPVYVLERLDVRSFIRLEEGAVYSYEEMKTATIGDGTDKHSVIMANDTTYTMAIEFLYGSGRYKFENEAVNKVIKLEEVSISGTKPKALAAGTRLTLIDVETGYSYYYEATEENQLPIKSGTKKGIPFSDFVRNPYDSTTKYVNRTMAEIEAINPDTLQANYTSFDTGNKVYSNVGVERYLLIVDGSQAVTDNSLYDITVVADETQNNNSKDIYPADVINVTSIPGLKVGFEGTGSRTSISGQMMRNEEIIINAVYGIKAQKLEGQGVDDEAPYWIMASSNEVIDSANNSKYLELAIYLQDKNGNRITLPQNTSVSMNGQILAANGSQSVYYYYKDAGKTESLDGITSDKEWEAQIRLGFETAILDSYNDEYSVVIELLRTDDPAYPMSGDKPDYYGEKIAAHIQTDLAVAMKADDLISLGINTYMETMYEYEIPCTSIIDFGSVIEFDLEDGEEVVNKQLTKWCDKTQFQITYRLYKRVNTEDGKEYVPIDDERISLWAKDDEAEGGYSALLATTDTDGQLIYREHRVFTQDEVREGTGESGGEGLITNSLLLKVDTEDITDSELSNYKLEMSVIAYDRAFDSGGNEILLNPTGNEAVLQDFFIFTIAKLKTDME